MGHEFEIARDIDVDASPEQVWEAVATGPGWDSWFMGRNEIEQREGGEVRWSIGGFTADVEGDRLGSTEAIREHGGRGPGRGVHQFDYRIEPREGGEAHDPVRAQRILGGDDWETEYAAMNEGDPMYLHKLAEYVTYFSGRFATPIDAHGPGVRHRDDAMRSSGQASGSAARRARGGPGSAHPGRASRHRGRGGLRVAELPGRSHERRALPFHLRVRRIHDGGPSSVHRWGGSARGGVRVAIVARPPVRTGRGG